MKPFLSILAFMLAVSGARGNWDILLYQHAPNPDGKPTNWVARQEYPLATNRPAPWIRMTQAQVDAHKAAAKATFDAWLAAREAAEATAAETTKRTREQLIADTIGDLDTALANWDTLTNAQQKAVLRRLVVIVRAILKEDMR